VHAWSANTGLHTSVQIEGLVGSIALAGKADLLVATSKGLFHRCASSGEMCLLANPNEGKPVRFNDGRVDPLGRFWLGTMALDPARYSEPLGELYRFDPDGRIQRMEEGLTISNGLDWSPDGQTLYLTDTLRRAIYAYDFDLRAGTIRNRRTLIRVEQAHGVPDGLTVDSRGHLWSACFGGSGICHYSPEGRLLEKVTLPVSCPTALTFGGADLSIAFITTSRHILASDQTELDAGSLWTATLNNRGQRASVFGQRGRQ
jgi:sugar lactone lactonase YvrE